MINPFISVLVTTYNREAYINQCLASILNSSYQNFEIVVVDDCSTDNTVELVKKFVSTHERVKLFVNNENVGQFKNRNKAASYASHDYLKFFDSDDVMYSHCLEVFAQAIMKFPNAALFAELQLANSSTLLPVLFNSHDAYINHYWKGSTLLYIGPSGTVYKRSSYAALGGIDEKIGILADTLLSLQLAAVAPCVGVSRDIFYWRRHDQQVTEGQKDIINMLRERYKIDQIALNDPQCPLKGNVLLATQDSVNKRFGRNVVKAFFKGYKIKDLRMLMRECNYSVRGLVSCWLPNSKKYRSA